MTRAFPRKPTLFFALAFGLALAVTLCVPWLGENVLILTMLTPLVSALVMLLWIAPEGPARGIPALLGLTRAGLKAWPMALAAPFGIHLLGMALLSAFGLAVFIAPAAGFGIDFTLNLVIGLIIGTLLALCEEVGWRGYLLPRVWAGRGPLQAMLIVGFLHGVWHLPLILGTPFYHPGANPFITVPMFLATLTLVGVFYGFLRIWTGSVWPVALSHGAANSAWNLFAQSNTTRTPLVEEMLGGESGIIVILGLAVICLVLAAAMRRPGFAPRLAPLR